MSPSFGVFSRGSLVKKRQLLLVEKLANVSPKEGCMAPSTSNNKDLGVVTPLVSAEKEQASFFYRAGSFFPHASTPFPVRGF